MPTGFIANVIHQPGMTAETGSAITGRDDVDLVNQTQHNATGPTSSF